MHRMTGLAAAIAAAVTLGIGIGWMLSPKEQTPTAPETTVAERELVTGTVASRAGTAAPPQPQAAQQQSFTPPDIVATLNREIAAIIADPGFHQRMTVIGVDVVGTTPAAYAKMLKDDYEKWGKVIAAAGIKPE